MDAMDLLPGRLKAGIHPLVSFGEHRLAGKAVFVPATRFFQDF
jgi:hypothetical protein